MTWASQAWTLIEVSGLLGGLTGTPPVKKVDFRPCGASYASLVENWRNWCLCVSGKGTGHWAKGPGIRRAALNIGLTS